MIREALEKFARSEYRKKTRPERWNKHQHNAGWLNPESIRKMSDEELKEKFVTYFTGGEGRQPFNQVWRDRLARDIPKLREIILHLFDESLPIEKRFHDVVDRDGEKHMEGIGKGLASAFLMDFNIDKYCLWNNKTEMGLERLGLELPYKSTINKGERYVRVLELLKQIRDEIGTGLNLDFDDIDNFLHWVAAEDDGVKTIDELTSRSTAVHEDQEAIKMEERLLLKMMAENFDTLFGPLGLKLYDEDPDQEGAYFRTPAGVIDLLAVEKESGKLCVIELKTGPVSDSSIGQLVRYMGYVKENIAGDRGVKGIILCTDIDDKMQYALKILGDVEFKRYKLNISFL